MASPFKRSDHIQPPDREGPSYGDCLESGRGHMTLIGKELATDIVLDKVLCLCLGCRPIKTCTEGFADKCPGCSVVPAESGMNFSQELPPLFLGYTSLKDSGGAFLVELSIMNHVGL